jgi:hypothetical protein
LHCFKFVPFTTASSLDLLQERNLFFRGNFKKCRNPKKLNSKEKSIRRTEQIVCHSSCFGNFLLTRIFFDLIKTFSWQLPIIIKYYKNDFTEENLYPNLAEHSSEDLGNELEEKWHKEEKSCKRPSLLRVLYGMFGRKYIAYGVLMLLLELATTYVCISIFRERKSFLFQIFATPLFETIAEVFGSASQKYHKTRGLYVCFSNCTVESPPSLVHSPVVFRTRFFGNKSSHSLFFPRLQEVLATEKRDLSKIHFGSNG